MLGKLLKYDFKWINKVMIIYYIIAFMITFLIKFVESLEMTVLVTIIDKILCTMLISCSFSILITTLIRIWVKFKTSIYKDESYLTHTLPVTKEQIFNSKIIVASLLIILSSVVIIACFAITYLNENTIVTLKAMFDNVSNIFGKGTVIGLIISTICIIILEIMYMVQAGIFGIILGNMANNHKTLRTVLIGLMVYAGLSGFALVILLIIAQFNPVLMDLYKTDIPRPEAIKDLIYISLCVYISYNILLYILSKKLLKRGVNVD